MVCAVVSDRAVWVLVLAGDILFYYLAKKFCSHNASLHPNRGHLVVFLGKILDSHSASLRPGVQMGTGEIFAGGNPAMD